MPKGNLHIAPAHTKEVFATRKSLHRYRRGRPYVTKEILALAGCSSGSPRDRLIIYIYIYICVGTITSVIIIVTV